MGFAAKLGKASEALGRGADEPALAAMLDAWRDRRIASLASLIDRLCALYEPLHGEIAGSRGEVQKAWLAKAERGLQLDLPLLLQYVAHGTQDQAVAQVEQLYTWPADPRTTAMVIRVLAKPPYATSSGTRQFYRRLFRMIEIHGDPAAIAALAPARINRTFSPNPRGVEMRNRAAAVVEVLQEQFPVPVPTADEAAAIARLVGQFEEATRTGADLVAEVTARPNDAHVRSVLADWLMLRSPARSESMAKRVATPVKKPKRR